MSGILVRIEVSREDLELPEKYTRSHFINKLADYFYQRVRFYTPVKTGKLKRGWRVSRTGSKITLRNKVKYASYLDDGTTKARDPSKGYMYERSLEDTIKMVKNRYDLDLKDKVDIERIET